MTNAITFLLGMLKFPVSETRQSVKPGAKLQFRQSERLNLKILMEAFGYNIVTC